MIDEPVEKTYRELNYDGSMPDWLRKLGEHADKIVIDALNNPVPEDLINSPSHYTSRGVKCPNCESDIQCIEVAQTFDFHLGNVIKYLWRHDHKDGLEGLKKAQWYLNDYIERMEEE